MLKNDDVESKKNVGVFEAKRCNVLQKLYCITRSFVVERYGTINEDSRELYGNCIKNDENFEFFGYFKVNFKHF